jgi:hypothetical protein
VRYLYHLRERKQNKPTMTAFATVAATFTFTFALVAVLVTPGRYLPDYKRGGWGRYYDPASYR